MGCFVGHVGDFIEILGLLDVGYQWGLGDWMR